MLLALAAAARLSAHAELVRSAPAAGSVVPTAPSRISISFSEAVDPTPDSIAVFDPGGARLRIGRTAPKTGDAATIEATIEGLGEGTHTVRWRVVSEDGHPINGTFQFSVTAASAVAPTTQDDGSADTGAGGAVAGRALHLFALSALIGPLALILALRSIGYRTTRRLWRMMFHATLGLLAATLVLFAAQLLAVSGSVETAMTQASMESLLATRWGRLWSYRTALVVVMIPLAAWGWWRTKSESSGTNQSALIFSTAGAAGLLLLTAMNGHSAATAPVWLSLSVDWVHLAATAIWIGGIAAIVVAVLPVVKRMPRDQRDLALAPTVRRFSTIALVCVEVLIITGFYHLWAHVDRPASLATTQYGLALLIKLGLVVAMMIPAAVNLLALRPRLEKMRTASAGDSVYGTFRRTLGAEFALGVVVLIVIGRLTSVPPARVEAAAAAARPAVPSGQEPGVTMTSAAGTTVVSMTVSPLRPGANTIDVDLDEGATSLAPRDPIRLRLVPPASSGLTPWVVVPDANGSRFHAAAALAAEGTWGIEVLLSTSASAAFSVDLPVRGARELLVASAERMRRSPVVVESIDTLENGILSQTRKEHRASAGSDIGAFALHPSADSPILIGRETVLGEECFVVSYSDAEGSRHRAWISTNGLRMVQHTSALAGRLVVSRFTATASPVRNASRTDEHQGHAADHQNHNPEEHAAHAGSEHASHPDQ